MNLVPKTITFDEEAFRTLAVLSQKQQKKDWVNSGNLLFNWTQLYKLCFYDNKKLHVSIVLILLFPLNGFTQITDFRPKSRAQGTAVRL